MFEDFTDSIDEGADYLISMRRGEKRIREEPADDEQRDSGFVTVEKPTDGHAGIIADTPTETFTARKRHSNMYPDSVYNVLVSWVNSHRSNPYPSEGEKIAISKKTGLTILQINNWMSNARRRRLRK